MQNSIFNCNTENFNDIAIDIFKYQAINNPVYKKYLQLINIKQEDITKLENIPFIPVEFFKSHVLCTESIDKSTVFSSSGTSGNETSKHFVYDIKLYEKSFKKSFQYFYGNIKDYCILALLPGYLERADSSLVYMADKLIRASKHPYSGFFLNDFDKLINNLKLLELTKQKTILIGVSYALLDLGKKINFPLENIIIMETGGMKGKRQELTKKELHTVLKKDFICDNIHSEYGMTELLSQAYSKKDGLFFCPPWMKILIRDIYDPFLYNDFGQTGGINVIDLANIYSCSFIETKDLGKRYPDGSFEILGRFDNSTIRGCNLLVD